MKEQMAHWWRVRPLQSQMPLGCKRVPVNRTPLPATVARLANTSLLPALYAFVRCRSSSRVIGTPSAYAPWILHKPTLIDLHKFARDPRWKDVAFSATSLRKVHVVRRGHNRAKGSVRNPRDHNGGQSFRCWI